MNINKKAISLIALAVTIIVIAILGTTVIITLTNSDLIDASENTVDKNALLQVTDMAKAAWLKAFADGDITTSEEYLNYIKEYLKNAGYTDKELEKYNITATTDGVTVTPVQGETEDPENSLVAMYKAGTLKQGDYVDYTPSLADNWTLTSGDDGAYTCVPSDSWVDGAAIPQEDLNWRVLGYDEENNELLLIAGSPTVNGIYVEYTRLGYNNYINALDSTCKALYSNTTLGAVARSVNINDLDTYLGGDAYDKTTYGNEVDENGNVTLINSGGYGYTSSTLYLNWYIDSTTGNFEYSETEKLFDKPSTVYSLNFQNITTNVTILEILGGPNTDYSYWVASRGLEVGSGCVGSIARVNSTYIGFTERAKPLLWQQPTVGEMVEGLPTTFRPVVALPSSITADDVPLIQDAPEETWVFPPEYGSAGGENWD